MKLEETLLQHIEFGEQPKDQFYCLVDRRSSPGGIDIDSLKLSDPRRLDQEFRDHGCLMLFTGDEIEELVSRGDLNRDDIHVSLYNRALEEGVIRRN